MSIAVVDDKIVSEFFNIVTFTISSKSISDYTLHEFKWSESTNIIVYKLETMFGGI